MTKELKLCNSTGFVSARRFDKADTDPRPMVCRSKTVNDRELVLKNA